MLMCAPLCWNINTPWLKDHHVKKALLDIFYLPVLHEVNLLLPMDIQRATALNIHYTVWDSNDTRDISILTADRAWNNENKWINKNMIIVLKIVTIIHS